MENGIKLSQRKRQQAVPVLKWTQGVTTCHQPASGAPKFRISPQQQIVATKIHPLSAWKTNSPLPRMQDRLKGSCALPVVGNTSGGSLRLSVMSEEHGAKPESTKVLPPQWRDSTEKQNRSNRSRGKAIYLLLAVFTLFISYLTRSQAQNHQMSFQRAPAETEKSSCFMIFLSLRFLSTSFSFSVNAQLLHSPIFTERISLLEAQLPACTSAWPWTLSLFMGKLQTGFLHFQNASNQFVIFLPLHFFGRWMVHTILSNNNQRRMKTAAAWEVSSGYDSSSPDAWKMSLKFSLP